MALTQQEQELYNKIVGVKDDAVASGYVTELKNQFKSDNPTLRNISTAIYNGFDGDSYDLGNGYSLKKDLYQKGSYGYDRYALYNPEGQEIGKEIMTGDRRNVVDSLGQSYASSLGYNPMLGMTNYSIRDLTKDYQNYFQQQGLETTPFEAPRSGGFVSEADKQDMVAAGNAKFTAETGGFQGVNYADTVQTQQEQYDPKTGQLLVGDQIPQQTAPVSQVAGQNTTPGKVGSFEASPSGQQPIQTNESDVVANFRKFMGRTPSTAEDWNNVYYLMTKAPQEVERLLSQSAPKKTEPVQVTPGATAPTTDNTIYADQLGDNATPINLPNANVVDGGSSVIAEANNNLKTLDDYIKAFTPPETETKQEYDALSDKINALLGQTTNIGADQLAAEQAQGLPELKRQYAELNAEILSRTAEYEALKTDIEGKPITMNSIIGAQAQVEKKKLSEIGLLQARALGMQGQISTAQEAANRAIDIKYQPIETSLKIYEAQLESLANELDREDSIALRAQQQMLADAKEEIADRKATDNNIQNIAITALSNGADNALVKKIQEAGTELEAMQLAGQLATSSGWQYVSTPAQRDALKAQGYEITQSGGRTYARPGAGQDPTVQAYVSQVKSGAIKLSSVPAEIRNDVTLALGSYSAPTGGGGGGTVSTAQSASILDDPISAGYQEGDIIEYGSKQYVVTPDGGTRNLTDQEEKDIAFSQAKQLIIANPDASDEEIKTALLQYTNLTVSEINAIIAER